MRAMNAETIVRDFCRAFEEPNLEKILGFFSEDAIYHNIPLEPAQGVPAIRAVLEQFISPDAKSEFEIRHIASSGNVVLTERVDHLSIQGKPVALPVMGTFEIGDDGKIHAWRDYFDMGQLTAQMG